MPITVIILTGNNISMSQDASGGWREERAHQGLDPQLGIEDMDAEDVSRILSDGGRTKEFDEHDALENDAWAAYHISRELQELHEENGDYWVLEVSDGDLEPVFVVREDEIVTNPPYSVENDFQLEINGETYDSHPLGVLVYTGEEELFRNRGFRTDTLELPVKGDQLEEVTQYDRLNNSYIAPGLTDGYREAAEDIIQRTYEEQI